MPLEPKEMAEQIRRWCTTHGGSVLFDPEAHVVHDVFSGKSLKLDLGAVTALEEKVNKERGGTYLALTVETGLGLVLAEPGVVFSPETTNTGPLASLPAAVCLRDFAAVSGKLRHILVDHPEAAPTQEELDMTLFCIAVLDGARRIGLEVGREEEQLDALLAMLEERGGPKPT